MRNDIVPPPLGMSGSDDSPVDLSAPQGATPEKAPAGALGSEPVPTPVGTASADDLSLSLTRLSPDPLLDEFKPARPEGGADDPSAPPPQPSSWTALDVEVSPKAEKPAVAHPESGVSAVVAALNLEPPATTSPLSVADQDTPGSISATESFAGLDFTAPPPSKDKDADDQDEEKGEDDDGDLPPRRVSLPMALLFSYASAVTIGLLWILWGHRVARERESVESDPFPPADTAMDPGQRADQSRKLVPPEPLPADRIARLGQAVQLGSLEVTPLEVTSGPVTLHREIGNDQARGGGDGALVLKLRLKNLSNDAILVPLDEAFLRERGRGIRDSFIETGPTAQIDMFPLAVVSEWSIVGQEFRELRPDESYETRIFTAPDAVGHLAPEMTWRIRLRTDINQTETLGVRFLEKEIGKPAR